LKTSKTEDELVIKEDLLILAAYNATRHIGHEMISEHFCFH